MASIVLRGGPADGLVVAVSTLPPSYVVALGPPPLAWLADETSGNPLTVVQRYAAYAIVRPASVRELERDREGNVVYDFAGETVG